MKGEEAIRRYFEDNGYQLIEEYLPYAFANWYFAPKVETQPPQ